MKFYNIRKYLYANNRKNNSRCKMQNQDSSESKEQLNNNELIFERVQVIKGTSDVGFTEVTFFKDLSPNTQVVTKGAFFVSAKMTNIGEEE